MPTSIIRACPPFDFAATARFLRFTEAEAVDTFREHRYARAFHLKGRLYLVRVEARGTATRPSLGITVEPESASTPQVVEKVEELIRHIFTVKHDLAGWQTQIVGDELMQQIAAEHRGLHLACWPTLFEALVVSILSQQISTAVAMVLKRRVVERFGVSLKVEGHTYYTFPRSDALAQSSVEDLRALGLSNAKALSIIELARADAVVEIESDALKQQDNEALIARLSQLRGVGRWTAEWALMLHFGRTNVFPAGDLFLRGAIIKYYNGGEPLTEREIRALAAERWGEWSSYAALYLLAGMRAGLITLKPERVLSSQMAVAKQQRRAPPRKGKT
ncbi:MAG: hypothetical protein M3Q76_02280 [Acidobacteriota bacterium]|nr:hypothetical protein [Acidobacteriota bacterium]